MRQSLMWIAIGLVVAVKGLPRNHIEKRDVNVNVLFCEKYNTSCETRLVESVSKPVVTTEKSFSEESQDPFPDDSSGGEGCKCVHYSLCNDTVTDDEGRALIDHRIARSRSLGCGDYFLICCKPDGILSMPSIPTKKPPVDQCGVRNPKGLGFKIGEEDSEAQYGEFPWMMAVIRAESNDDGSTVKTYLSGGSLIHPKVVLTGAYWVNGRYKLMARAGEWDTQSVREPQPHQDIKVQQVIVHEEFNNETLINNVALLILEQPVDMSVENVGLICLPEAKENMDNRDCVVSGWGKDKFGKESNYRVTLKKVELPMVPRGKCQSELRKTRLGSRFRLHDTFVCAGGKVGKDTCRGDGGSPLVCTSKNNPDVYVQAGIVAWGIGCNTETPAVYTDVSKFINWVHNKLQAQDISLS